MRRYKTYLFILISIFLIQCGGDFGFEPDVTPPAAPEITYITSGDGIVLLMWNSVPSHDLTAYKIFSSEGNESNYILTSQIGKTDTFTTIVDLTNNVEYFFKMTAIDDSGNESDTSNIVSATPVSGGLPVPFIIFVEAGYESVSIQWNPVVSLTLDHFAVYISEDGENYTLSVEPDKDSLQCRISGIPNSINYFIKMASVSAEGNEGEYSNIVTARPPGAQYYLDAGWNLFEEDNYEQAIEQFDTCLIYYGNLDNYARTGLGWAYAYLASLDGSPYAYYETAKNYFELADNIDARAGVTIVYNVLNEYENSVLTGKQVIAEDADYQFSHDPFVDIVLIRLTVAMSAFELGDYNEVVAQLNIIDPGYPHSADDPDSLLERLQYVWEMLYNKK